jgi:hypothetical protein
MRAAGRFLITVFCLVLICGAIGSRSRSRLDVPERGTTFHQPYHQQPAIETPLVNTATSFADERIAALVTGVVLRTASSTRFAARRSSRATVPAPETALDQRPPPHSLLA